nr:immunoglobulin light chain junction region [Macaca mulatta]MOW08305.1 immunoglobulin light chain junction region [Macaca mulatta]MOW08401.1 immunoglobulin light chain junction region [Macaca mulatta]MOW09014.1 immunoglobulin light chain junction region [Macaca mulatta]MOW09512.1 immunoglobulin light chain junction region [Macaca mulatta]
CQQYYRAPFTF